MNNPPLYVLDTNILIHLCRNDSIGQEVSREFDLPNQPLRPAICVVTHGEILSFARQHRWGEHKSNAMSALLDNLVVIDISSRRVLDAYAELDMVSQQHGEGARNMGKNDIWIAATTRACGGVLLTTDRDFDHLHPDWIQREYIDPGRFRRHLSPS